MTTLYAVQRALSLARESQELRFLGKRETMTNSAPRLSFSNRNLESTYTKVFDKPVQLLKEQKKDFLPFFRLTRIDKHL